MNLHSTRILCFLVLLHMGKAIGQHEDILQSVSDQLELTVQDYVRETVIRTNFSEDLDDLQQLFQTARVDSAWLRSLEKEQLAEIEWLEQDKGVDLVSSYAQNFAGSLLEDDGTFYQWRANTGLGWNIMRSGLLDHKHQAAQQRLEWQARKQVEEHALREELYRKRYNFIIYSFNHKKLEVIRARLEVLEALSEVARKLFYLRYIQWEEVLDVMSRKTETELFLKNFETYLSSVVLDSALLAMRMDDLPLFDLNYPEIQQKGIDTSAQHLAMTSKIKALDHQFHWTRDISLNAQLRYNYYQGGPQNTFSGRDFLAGGVTLAIPLGQSKTAKATLKEARSQRIQADYREHQKGLQNDILNHHYEFEYAYKQYVNFFYKKERLGVLIKRAIRKRDLNDPDYSPKEVVNKLDELFSVDLELLDIQQKMYLKTLKIMHLINADSIRPYIDLRDLNHYANQFEGERNLHCSADDFAAIDIRFLSEFLNYHSIREVTVAIDDDLDLYLKYAELLDELQGKGRSVRLSIKIADMHPQTWSMLEDKIEMALTPLVHLDLTEMVLVGMTDLTALGQQLQTFIQSLGQGHNLTVSVPLDFGVTFAPFLAGASAINLFATKSQRLPGYFHQVQKWVQQMPYSVRVGIDPKDFQSRLEMDSFIAELLEHLQMEQVCVRGLESFLYLEEKAITWHEEYRF